MNNIQAIRAFFEKDSVRGPLALSELKVLTSADRKELGALAAKELGIELDAKHEG